ncbi:MAG: hypothetical protein ACREDS_16580, partial [Limisphaerales bacterium]
MDAPERGALMLVRFVAVCLIGWAIVDIALYCVLCEHKNVPIEILPCVLKSIPAIVGIAALIKS